MDLEAFEESVSNNIGMEIHVLSTGICGPEIAIQVGIRENSFAPQFHVIPLSMHLNFHP